MMLSIEIFKKGLKDLQNAFDGFKITEAKITTWYKYSKSLDDDTFQMKIDNCIKGCRRPPSLADILDQKKYYEKEKIIDYPEYEEEEFIREPIPKGHKERMAKITGKAVKDMPKDNLRG